MKVGRRQRSLLWIIELILWWGKRFINMTRVMVCIYGRIFLTLKHMPVPLTEEMNMSIFTANFGNGIGHFNGNDIEILYETDLWNFDTILFDEDVFFVCLIQKTSVDVIIHGKLNTN